MIARRSGFTIVEMIVAMTLTLAVFAITLPFVRSQTRALGASAGRLDAEQVARYAQRAIDRDLRLASADVGQPLLVYAGPMGIAFNANLLAVDTSDPGAADREAGAATTLTDAWRLADAAAIPRGGRTYPTVDYTDEAGATSRNETISYFLHPDTVSSRSDLYVLYRRVNARDSVQIVRGIHVPVDSAFFSYLRRVGGALTAIADSRLPLYWDSTAIDSVTTVGIRSAGWFRDRSSGADVIRTVHWQTAIPNARARVAAPCGAIPANPSAVDHLRQSGSSGYRVRVTWDGSGDDGAASDDVTHYLIGTKLTSDPNWTVVASVPARRVAIYQWDHHNPTLLGTVVYGVRAVDCGGSMSSWVADGTTVSLPP